MTTEPLPRPGEPDGHTQPDMVAPKISIVIPLYNEEDSIPHLWEELDKALAHYGQPAEVIIVDDGSKDRSFALLKEIAEKDPRFTIIRFRRNFGQTAGFAAGFAQARGEVVITMDADLQNDPMDIPLLMAQMDAGYDIVSGWRKDRQDRYWDRRLPSMLAESTHLQRDRCASPRLWLLAQGLSPGGAPACTSLWRAAPVHSGVGQPGGRLGDRGAGQPSGAPVWPL